MKEKVCIVTGANTGIGLETARALARQGATVILACRNQKKGETACADVKQTTGNNQVHLFQVDLGHMQSIRSFAADFKQRFSRLDVLVNNAGVFKPVREVTPDGFETTFATNHLGYFLLTHDVLDVLGNTPGARIINVSSDAHRAAQIDFEDLHLEKGYSGYKSYARSKLANILFSTELSKRLQAQYPASAGPTVNSLHPGVVATNIAGDMSHFFGFFFKIFSPFFLSPARGAKTSIYLATSSEVEGVTGKYFEKCAAQVPASSATDPVTAKRLYEISAKLTGVKGISDNQPS